MASLYDVRVEDIRAIEGVLDRRIEKLFSIIGDAVIEGDDEVKENFSFAVASLITLKDDIRAVINERKSLPPMSGSTRKLVESLINDTLIDINTGLKNERGCKKDDLDERSEEDAS